MEKKFDRSGVLIKDSFKELVHEIAQLTEMAGGWRNFYTDDPADTMQVIFLWSRLRDESMGMFDVVPNSLFKRTETWGDSINERVNMDDILQLYHCLTVNDVIYSMPMVRFRVTPDNDYFLLDYEMDFPFDESKQAEIFQGEEALEIAERWLKYMNCIYNFI